MARRYDSRTTIFSPEGRLYQVEYAMEAINHAGACLGIVTKEGIVLAAENLNTNPLLDTESVLEKIYTLTEDITCSVAGITADANVLVLMLRNYAQKYQLQYGEPIPVEQLVRAICDYKQAYTQYGGKRPYGVSLLYIGWDNRYGYQLYQSDPSGNYSGWKATCIGNNSQSSNTVLQDEYDHEKMTMDQAMLLAVRILEKAEESRLKPEKIEITTLKREDDKTVVKLLSKEELATLIGQHHKIEEEKEKRKAKMAGQKR